MALVGMASKPLHVRRFQKSLAEWVSDPAAFKLPLSSIGEFSFLKFILTYYFLPIFMISLMIIFQYFIGCYVLI